MAKITAYPDGNNIQANDKLVIARGGQNYNIDGLKLSAGEWTPTGTIVANCDAISENPCKYTRFGDTVSCFGVININPTAATTTRVRISLPFSTNFTAASDAVGILADSSGDAGILFADTVNDEVELRFEATIVTAKDYYFTFTYLVQ